MVSGTRGKSALLCTGDYKREGIRERTNEPKTRAQPAHSGARVNTVAAFFCNLVSRHNQPIDPKSVDGPKSMNI